ncbi:hypothetical protein FIM1_44 [Kluyveromyces marxianus]|uniref:Uncharacterized protein n=1 Tax=Kluyveromyces marxianus TaxID=4911 RepID=A0ABX6EP24_KLUMA|nr:hypothetical protein FIM1_44 [Kluyveromyces marxianus]
MGIGTQNNKRVACLVFVVFNLITIAGLSFLALNWNKPDNLLYCFVILLLPVPLWLWAVISWSASQIFAYGK